MPTVANFFFFFYHRNIILFDDAIFQKQINFLCELAVDFRSNELNLLSIQHFAQFISTNGLTLVNFYETVIIFFLYMFKKKKIKTKK